MLPNPPFFAFHMEASSYLQSPAMSIVSLSDRVLIYQPSPLLHRRNDSGELDVFEAAGYFSGYTEATGGGFYGGSFTQKIVEEESKIWRGRGRISLDMTIGNMVSEQCFNGGEKEVEEKKFKQPSSPGGKLGSFLNSLFNKTNSKKKKKKKKKAKTKSAVQSLTDEEESPAGGRRKKRSSLSHFPSSNHTDSKSMNTSSDFRFPLRFVQTPTKNVKEFKQKVTSLKHNAKPDLSGEKKDKDSALVHEKFKFGNGFSEKQKQFVGNGLLEKDQKMTLRGKREAEEKKCFNGGSVDADGGESDSSSDLFELQISNLNHLSSNDLPVYETTKLEKIERKSCFRKCLFPFIVV